ncbi:hypothetical protein CIK05_04865 [Bdellovibrio sp. qaytius]|nr:hypothetical protein CIK05_04865 [Bdellovibrio sp. qaytius]
MLRKIGLSLLVIPLVVGSLSRAADGLPSDVGPQAQDAVNFDHATDAKTSISQQMVLFEMPPEYECPLFSNSPYTEILSSLDKMQENLNTVFPQCDTKAQNEKVAQKAVELRNAVFDAKKLQDSGQTFKLELSAQNMVDAAQKIQEALALAAQSQTRVCYRSNQQFRNVVFSINETFQGIAPVVLDMISKNPVLGAKLGPAVKILAGADALSKGLGFVEQIAQDSIMFDMTDQNNRVNTLKNVCQYMKLYRRLDYMRSLKLGQIQSVYAGYQSRIRDLSQNITDYRRKNSMEVAPANAFMAVKPQAAALSNVDESDPNFQLFSSLKNLLPDELNKLQKAQYDLELATKDLQRPEVAQCQIIETTKTSVTYKKTVEKLVEFAKSWADQMGGSPESAASVQVLKQQLDAYDEYFNEAKTQKNLSECVKLGEDWIKISLELLSTSQKMVHMFAQEQAELQTETDSIKEKKLSKKEREKENALTNLASLKSMMQYAAFESSEIEKRAKDMHRYFFRGPYYNEVKGVCADENNCGWWEKTVGGAKAAYQWQRNNGPVYELLRNNDLHFNNAYNQMIEARAKLNMFEYQFAQADFKDQHSSGTLQAITDRTKKYSQQLTHLSLKYIKKGSPMHQNLCMNARQMLDKYLVASTHMLSSQALCNMVYPALKEDNVATALRDYCIPRAGITEAADKPSKLQQLIYTLIGEGEGKQRWVVTFGDTEARLWDVSNENSPKALVDKLIEKYDNLECEQKSGF